MKISPFSHYWQILAIAITLFFAISSTAYAQTTPPPDLFQDAEAPITAAAADPASLRDHYVTLQAQVLPPLVESLQAQPGSVNRIRLNLFADAQYTALLDDSEVLSNGVTLLRGTLEDTANSQVTLALQDGSLYGVVRIGITTYQVQIAGEGTYRISQLNPQALPPDVPEMLLPEELAAQSDATAQASDDDGSLIDVLVVYTDDALTDAGSSATINQQIANAINDANVSFANSNIQQRFRLVAANEAIYNESNFDWNQTLNALTDSGDSKLEQVQGWRNQYAADLTVLIVKGDNRYCGLGWLLSPQYTISPQVGYSVVARNCLWYQTLAHETGHNMGAHHDWANSGGENGYYSYSHGFQNQDGGFYTIMSYYNGCTGCGRISYWSSPSQTYNGYALGDSRSDNVKTLNNTALTVANFRDGFQTAPGGLNAVSIGLQQIQLTWTDGGSDEKTFRIERKLRSSSTWAEVISVAANTTSLVDSSGLSCEATYDYRVRAAGSNGYSAYSNTASAVVQCSPTPPTNFTAAAQLNGSQIQIALSWTDASNNENGFYVDQLSNDGSTWNRLSTLAANSGSYTVTSGLVCSKTYTFRVGAYNAYPPSANSPTASATTIVCAPGSLGAAAHAQSQSRMVITWNDQSPDETGFKLERSPRNANTWAQIALLPANTTSHTDLNLTCNTSYDYRIRATSSRGDSLNTGPVVGTTRACGVPLMPIVLGGSPTGRTSIALQWPDIDDETGCIVERSANGSSGWAQVGSVAQNVTSFSQNGLQPDTPYYYRVRAFNGYGNAPGYSNVKSLRTFLFTLFAPLVP